MSHPNKWYVLGAFAVCLGTSAWVFAPFWDGFFYKDDFLWAVLARDLAQSPGALFQADAHNAEAAFRVTQRVTLALAHAGFGSSPTAFHLSSLLVHAATCAILFRLCWQLVPTARGAGAAVVAAMFFATSTAHDTALIWISAQSGLWATLFVLALFSFVLSRRDRLAERRVMVGAAVLWLLALLSKHTVFLFPLALLVYFILERSKPGQRLAGLLFVVGLAYLLVAKVVLAPADGGTIAVNWNLLSLSSNTALNLLAGLLAPFVSVDAFEKQSLVPFGLAAVLVGLGMVVAAERSGRRSEIYLGLTWMLLLVAPVALLDYRQYDSTYTTANRYYYPASAGAALILAQLVAWGFHRMRPRTMTVIAAALIIAFPLVHRPQAWFHQERLRVFADASQRFLEHAKQKAREEMPAGTILYAVGWTDPEFLAYAGRLYFEPLQVEFQSEEKFDELVAHGVPDDGRARWVSVYDDNRKGFGTMPLETYLHFLEQSSR